MKRYLPKVSLTILLLLSLLACQKEPEPFLADQVAGEYTGTYYTVGGTTRVNLPATNNAGVTATSKLSATKVTDDSADFKVVFSATDKTGQVVNGINSYSGLTLKKAATGEIEGYQGSTRYVIWNNNELSIIVPDPVSAKTVVFYGKKN